jgi:hypothetical protein
MITFQFIGQAKGNAAMQAELYGLIREGYPTLNIGPLQPNGTFSAEVTQSQATSIINDIGTHLLARVESAITPALLLVAAVVSYYLLR